MKEPLVSIMIPTYCQEKVVLDAVMSALNQDYPNIEIIVADDASPDNTPDVISTIHDNRLKYHRNKTNLGRVGNYRNTLYNLAKGDWVVNLDGDDFFTNNSFISSAVNKGIIDPEIVMVCAPVIAKGGFFSSNSKFVDSQQTLQGHQALYSFVFMRYPLFHMATLYRREVALRSNFYSKDTISSDTESLWRLALKGKVTYINQYAGVWRVTNLSASRTTDWQRLLDDLDIWPEIFKEAKSLGMTDYNAVLCQKRIIQICAYGHLSALAISGRLKSFKKYIRRYIDRYGVIGLLFIATRWRLYPRILLGLYRNISKYILAIAQRYNSLKHFI